MNNFKAVIFDLDGTLLDTIDDLADSMNAVLLGLGCPVHATSAYKYFVGDGLEKLAQRVLPRDKQSLVNQCAHDMLQEYEKRWADKTKPYKNIPELLKILTHKNIKIAILSNKPHEFTQKTVSRFLGEWKFAEVLGARKGVPKKPDPAGAIEISQKIGIPPHHIMYLGDTNTDMKTALSAGMFAVGVLWGFRCSDELKNAGAKLLINDPMELESYF